MNAADAATTALTPGNLDADALRQICADIERNRPVVFLGVHANEVGRAWIMQVPQIEKYRGGTVVILPKGTDPSETRREFERAGYRVEVYP